MLLKFHKAEIDNVYTVQHLKPIKGHIYPATVYEQKSLHFVTHIKHLAFCGGLCPKCFCNVRKQIHLWRGWPQRGAKPNKGVQLLTCYAHCNAIPAQTPLLFNLLSFRNGLALCSGQAGSHSCSASVRLDGAAVRKSALPSDWKSMLGISCLCSSAWRSCSVYRGFSGSPGPAAVLRHGIGAVGPLSRCQPASLAASRMSVRTREVGTAGSSTRPAYPNTRK